MKVKSERDPMDCSLPGSSVRGVFQARVLEWGATAFSEKYANERETLNRSLQDKAEEISRSRGPIKRNEIMPLAITMAPHSSTLAWKTPRTEEPDRLQSMGSQRVGHD